MGRKGENIRKRKDGRWEARIVIGYGPDHRARYYSVYGKTYQETKSKKQDWLIHHAKQEIPVISAGAGGRKTTVKELMEKWLEEQRSVIKQSTYAHYSYLLEKHIYPDLGSCYVSSVNNQSLDAFLKNKLMYGRLDGRGGLSAKTVSDIRSLLKSGFSYALEQGYSCEITGKLYYPKQRKPRTKILTRQEQLRLEQYLSQNPEPLELGILTVLYSGLRIGEICALTWGDVNFENGTISVSKTLTRIQDRSGQRSSKTRLFIDRPKTESSVRIIPLPTAILELLKRNRLGKQIYLLTGTESWLEPRLCLMKYKKILERAGLEPCTFHTLRHTFATRCVEAGFDAKSLSEILGHANVNTTLQRYVHPTLDQKKIQMERLLHLNGQNPGHFLREC